MHTVGEMAPRSPDFFCIGAQKAGTTWLYENLRRHPGIWMPPIKELQYFNHVHVPGHRSWTQWHRDSHALRLLKTHLQAPDPNLRYIRLLARITDPAIGDDWYRSIFAFAENTTLCGEMTPEYSILPDEGIAHLRAVAPTARAIFIMRDPIDRCWSHIRMIHRNNASTDMTLEEAARFDDVHVRADYPAIIDRWRAHLDARDLHLSFFDDIGTRPAALFGEVLEFLGLDFDAAMFPELEKVVHPGRPLDIPAGIHDYMRQRLEPVYDEMARRFGGIVDTWRARHYG
ncbi:sulfotransferase family protein [Jhaorihella thermophila]|uniref:Sulfotransferase family protein n=1 Tax=Jhaorihella thermophila TaxID=488547 RepID=A0A1H5Y7T1_9RHOB|nr:sulfotransferase [Jhaorihella thermophila]SEG20063.1 Sulfotransferase family protein [Jhaorihella thermophila]